MKAIVCTGKGEPLQLQEVVKPQLGSNEALVRIKAAAFNHRDLWIQQGLYADLKYPVILGSDGCGVVEAVSSDVLPLWKEKEVIINPAFNWGEDTHYQSKEFKILGLPDNGCFAEYVVVNADNLVAKPEHLSYEEAAAIPLAGLTGYRALFTRGQVKKGDNVLITGIGGGVAQMMMQMAIAIGANVCVTSGDEKKINRAKKMGALKGVSYHAEGWAEQLLSNGIDGFDAIIDSAAGDNFGQFIDLAKPGGRIVFFGSTKGQIPSLDTRKIFWKQLNILGTTMGSPMEFIQMVSFINEMEIYPVIDEVFDMQDAESAIRRMDVGAQFGKMILKIEKTNEL